MSKPTDIMSGSSRTNSSRGSSRKTDIMNTVKPPGDGGSYINIGDCLDSTYTIREPISEVTGESQIFLCSDGHNEFVAKIYHKNRKPGQKLLDVLQGLNSPLLIKRLAHGEFKGRFYEILPFYRQGTLEDAAPLDPEFLRNVVLPDVNKALALLHNNGIIHRDVKPGNLFFTDDKFHVVLGDFGISSFSESGITRITSAARTIGYSAPETCANIVSPKSDYYSFGITLLHLIIGHDPFKGMSDVQVTDVTLSGKISIPAIVPDDLTHLVRGMTLKEREDRWGFDEVQRWCAGERVEVIQKIYRMKVITPYPFEGREYDNLDELALAFAREWEETEKNLYRGLISNTFKINGRPDLASKVMDCEEEKDHNIGIAKLIGILNPYAPLCWKGEIFYDLPQVAEKIQIKLPVAEKRFHDLLVSGVLELFLERTDIDSGLIQAAENLKQAQKDEAVFRLYFMLIGEKGLFRFQDKEFFTVEELMEYIVENGEFIVRISEQLLGDPYFFVWLDYLGFADTIEAWKQIDFTKLEKAV